MTSKQRKKQWEQRRSVLTPLVHSGGRPPEVVPGIQSGPSLEWSASPTSVQEQPVNKKNRTTDIEGVVVQEMVVDTMEDMENGEHGKGTVGVVGPDQSGKASYAHMVAKSGSDEERGKSAATLTDEEVVILENDVLVDRRGAIPSIQFSDRVHDQVDRNMRNDIIVRLLGRNIGYKSLWSRMHAIWKPVGDIQLIDLDNSYFLVRFAAEKDYTKVLTEGPWTIYGSYLTVQPWSRKFSTSENYPSQVIVWVRLPGLPFRYYTKVLFRHIASLIGNVVKVDYNTKEGERGKFARLALLVDLSKPLLSCIRIDGQLQKIEYEGLQQICFECGVYGHSKEACTKGKEAASGNADQEGNQCPEPSVTISESNLFGPWMVVDNRRRNPVGIGRAAEPVMQEGRGHRGSRFAALEVSDDGGLLRGSGENVHGDPPMVEVDARKRDGSMDFPRVTREKNSAYVASNPEKKNQEWSQKY
ncbi:hypothetical protein GQ457_09G008060 [Hibiscus cannabinus]